MAQRTVDQQDVSYEDFGVSMFEEIFLDVGYRVTQTLGVPQKILDFSFLVQFL